MRMFSLLSRPNIFLPHLIVAHPPFPLLSLSVSFHKMSFLPSALSPLHLLVEETDFGPNILRTLWIGQVVIPSTRSSQNSSALFWRGECLQRFAPLSSGQPFFPSRKRTAASGQLLLVSPSAGWYLKLLNVWFQTL